MTKHGNVKYQFVMVETEEDQIIEAVPSEPDFRHIVGLPLDSVGCACKPSLYEEGEELPAAIQKHFKKTIYPVLVHQSSVQRDADKLRRSSNLKI